MVKPYSSISALVLAGLMVAAAAAQTFDAASVKVVPPVGENWNADMNEGPRRITYNSVTLEMLLTRAYNIKDFQLKGPDWLTTDHYTVTATTSKDASDAQIGKMLQALLAERFHMQVHREKKDLPVSALVVAKGGPKMKKLPEEPQNSNVSMSMGVLEAHGADMPEFAEMLAKLLGRPVVDMTALDGAYDFRLEFAAEPGMAAVLLKMGASQGGDLADGKPSIYTALQEQLGLKIEQRKAPLDIIVVDHTERIPTEN